MNVESLLEQSGKLRTSLLIIEERDRKEIVVGVPHHAPVGTIKLPCPQHTDSDENTGYLGRQLAEALNCCSIIACNYTMDVNKIFRSDYAMQIATWKPRVLVEIHGHKGRTLGGKAKHDIEISSGSDGNDRSTRLVQKIKDTWDSDDKAKGLRIDISGEHSNIYFKAENTITVEGAPWLAYHIELPPELRTQAGAEKPPDVGYLFCKILGNVLRELHLTNHQ